MTTADGDDRHPLDDDATAIIAVDRDQDIDPGPLRDLMAKPGIEVWPGVIVRRQEPVDGVWMRISVTEPGAAWLITNPDQLAATGRARLFRPASTSCIIEGDSIALFRFRSLPDTRQSADATAELGALGFGPRGGELADRVVAAIHDWDHDPTRQPEFTLHPAGTPDNRLPAGTVIDKTHRRLVIRYPDR